MPLKIRYYLTYFYYGFFRSFRTPGKLSLKRFFLLVFLFFVFPVWNLYIRIGLYLDHLLFPKFKQVHVQAPVFIIGNYRSGSTFFHRLILRDQKNTCLKAWEIYFAPALTHRKIIRLLNRISQKIGNPIEKSIHAFDRLLNDIYSMHKTGLFTYEQDSQLFYHIWSSYNLFAIFPFPELAKKYIYYDQMVPENRRQKEFTYYRDALKRHMFQMPGKRYIAKNPDFTPAVETLQQFFPDAKFINIIRPPEQTIPSTINLWANNWRAYGSPDELYPLQETLKEHIRHWYKYPHEQLSDLPPDRYQVVDFTEFVDNPRKIMEQVYDQFGFELSKEYIKVLDEETVNGRNFTGGNSYSLSDMGLEKEQLIKEYEPILEAYQLKTHLQEFFKKIS